MHAVLLVSGPIGNRIPIAMPVKNFQQFCEISESEGERGPGQLKKNVKILHRIVTVSLNW